MGLFLWPAAVLLFLFWSLAAWVMFGLSEWAAGLVSGVVGGVLSAELGPWAAWLLGSLGNIIQFGVVAVWAIVSLLIFAAPLWLRRQRRAGRIPETYAQGYGFQTNPANYDRGKRRDDDDDDDDDHRQERGKKRRDRDAWQQRVNQSYAEVSFLRDAARDLVGKYRHKKSKKKWDD